MDKVYPSERANKPDTFKVFLFLLSILILLVSKQSIAQTSTSWKGTQSSGWFTAANWTNGVPSSTTDVVIGDENFTGVAPVFASNTSIRSLTIGGAKAVSFSITDYKTVLKVFSDVTIAANGILDHTAAELYIGGNLSNSGTYRTAAARGGNKMYNARVYFNGTSQSISGAFSFMDLTINQGSTTTMKNAVTVSANFTVAGTFDPGGFLLTLTGATFTIGTSATARIKASTYAGNYSIAPTTLYTTSTIEYAATDIAQSVSALSNGMVYPTLVISGGSTKTLTSNISFTAATSADGKLIINGGTLDLGAFTANRGTATAGGTIQVANGAALKIGGTNSFPLNFATRTLGSTSTVEYSGTNQTVRAEAYGHLRLSSSSGAAVKTMPGVAFTITGNLTSTIGAGTAVEFTAGQNITVNGSVVLGSGTTFKGGAFTHSVDGDWTNNGTFNPGTSTVVLRGTNKVIAGTAQSNFNNLTLTGTIRAKATAMTVAGNLSTSGAGTFVHAAEANGAAASGTLHMSGTGKTISGTDITFDNLAISGTVTSASDLVISGDLNVTNTTTNAFNLTGGTVQFSGTGKTISANEPASLNFNGLRVSGTVSTGSSFSVKSDLSGRGVLTATAGTVSFIGSSTYAGIHKLFHVTLNGIRLQLAANASLGIAGSLTLTTGTFDVTTSAPNAVEYTGGNQNITVATYHTLILAGTGTKTGINTLTTNGNLEIRTGVTFQPGSYTHTIKGNWVNGGAFSAGTSNIQFTGLEDSQISGATTFHSLTVNKGSSTHFVTLINNVTAANVIMTAGEMRTGSNSITITNTRTGDGVILGTITRTHPFAANTAYAFEGPANLLTFGTASNITSVTVTVTLGQVNSFPYGGSVNRHYAISIPDGTYTNATLRLHYQDNELNGASEDGLQLWNYGTLWVSAGKSSNNSTANWVENTGLSNLAGQWTLSEESVVLQWTGNTSSDWHTVSNWAVLQGATAARVPLSIDIVDLGGINFVNQPIINANASAKSIQFGSARNGILSLAGGSLTVAGNINGAWSANATHTLSVGSQNLIVRGSLTLSDGTTGRAIDLSVGTGSILVEQTLVQSGNAAITFSGAGNLSVGDNFDYMSGSFTPHTGTVTYNGSSNQAVAGNITYYHLALRKAGGVATMQGPASILGNLSLTTGGTLVTKGNLQVSGNIEIGAGTTFNGGADVHTVGGNWANAGSFLPSSGTVQFSGTANQTISATTFNNLTVNKTAGLVRLAGNLVLNANLTVEAGALNLLDYTITRSAVGGVFTLGPHVAMFLSGNSNFPKGFNTNTLASSSTVFYNGTVPQEVARVVYGDLVFNNGTTNGKTLIGSTTVKGNLTIGSGATLHAGSFSLTAEGNIVQSGNFDAGTGTVFLSGTSKTTSGDITFNDLTVTGSYTVASGSITVNNTFYNGGSVTAGTNRGTFSGDFTNAGSISSDGITTFTGTKLQTIQLIGTFSSTAAGVTIFNGNVAPVFVSNSAPSFVSVIINNTAGISPSVDWTIYGMFKVAGGAAFHGGGSTHAFHGDFVNEGTVTSGGKMLFTPSLDRTLSLGTAFNSSGTVLFGGGGRITVANSPGTFTNIEVANTNVAGVTPPVNWQISGDLTIRAGSHFNGGTDLLHAIKGDLLNDGILRGNTATFTFMPSASVIYGTGSTSFYHLVINDSTTISTDLSIRGNFTNNGVVAIPNSTVRFNGTSGQAITGTAQTSFFDLVISNSAATVSADINLHVERDFIIEAGGVFKPGEAVVVNSALAEGALSGSGTVEVTRALAPTDYADQYKFAVYNLNALTVKFSGTAPQSSTLTSFHNLTVSNPAGFTLTGPTSVAGTFRLDNSKISTSGHILTVGTSAASPGSVEVTGAGMVAGQLKRWVPASAGSAINFPVGTGSTRRTATIQYSAAPTGGTLTAEFVTAAPGTSGLPLTEPNGDQADILVNSVGTSGYWTIKAGTTGAESLSGGVYNITLEATAFEGISELNSFVLLKRSQSTLPWELHGNHVTATGTAGSPVISRTGLFGFSDFALGGQSNTPLPVSLVYLKAARQGTDAIITWKTASEVNSRGFYVEVSADALNFRPLGFVPSKQPDTSTEQNYRFTDTENGKGSMRYYRLKQVDLDGKSSLYGPRVVHFKEEAAVFAVYPNPFSRTVQILLEAPIHEKGTITLQDLNGKVVWATEQRLLQGKNHVSLEMPGNLAKGLYFLKIQLTQSSKTVKLVKE